MKQHKRIEIYEFIHRDISVMVKIDYLMNEISLLKGNHHIELEEAKHYVFAGRGAEFMNNWLVILDALGEAVRNAKRKYEANLAEESSFKREKVVKVLTKKK